MLLDTVNRILTEQTYDVAYNYIANLRVVTNAFIMPYRQKDRKHKKTDTL